MLGFGDKFLLGLGQFIFIGNREQDWVNMFMALLFFKQINDLADMLDKTEGGIVGGDKVLGRSECNTLKEIWAGDRGYLYDKFYLLFFI